MGHILSADGHALAFQMIEYALSSDVNLQPQVLISRILKSRLEVPTKPSILFEVRVHFSIGGNAKSEVITWSFAGSTSCSGLNSNGSIGAEATEQPDHSYLFGTQTDTVAKCCQACTDHLDGKQGRPEECHHRPGTWHLQE